jgi:hypothetical protein
MLDGAYGKWGIFSEASADNTKEKLVSRVRSKIASGRRASKREAKESLEGMFGGIFKEKRGSFAGVLSDSHMESLYKQVGGKKPSEITHVEIDGKKHNVIASNRTTLVERVKWWHEWNRRQEQIEKIRNK